MIPTIRSFIAVHGRAAFIGEVLAMIAVFALIGMLFAASASSDAAQPASAIEARAGVGAGG